MDEEILFDFRRSTENLEEVFQPCPNTHCVLLCRRSLATMSTRTVRMSVRRSRNRMMTSLR